MNKRVVLVFPRFEYPSGDFSIGLAYIAGYIRKNIKDLDISILDTTFNPKLEYVSKFIEEKKPDIVGIYTDTLMFKDSIKVAKIAKKFKANVILGGPHPTIIPDETIKNEFVDSICIGEGEITFKEYIDCYYSDKNFKMVKGIWFKKEGHIIKNEHRDPIQDLDKIPFPAIDLFDIENYINKFVQLDSYSPNLRGISIIVSRGCPFMCSYCQPTLKNMFGTKVRIMSPKKVVDELKEIKKNYRIDAFYFQDDTLTAFKKWVNDFCGLLRKEKLNLVWACNTRADTIDFETLEIMKKAGCIKLKVGIESITDRIRNGIYKKNISVDQIKRLIDYCDRLKIQLTGFFMLGAPTETEKEVIDTIKFAARSKLTEANFSITTPLPETGLYNFVKDRGWTLPNDLNMFDYYQVKRPKMSKNEISIKKLKFYKKLANFYFYLHPRRIFITLRSILSIKGIKKLALKLKRI
jgi:radical SAM superfamily enzyme YgiQ (UPF0313 family)